MAWDKLKSNKCYINQNLLKKQSVYFWIGHLFHYLDFFLCLKVTSGVSSKYNILDNIIFISITILEEAFWRFVLNRTDKCIIVSIDVSWSTYILRGVSLTQWYICCLILNHTWVWIPLFTRLKMESSQTSPSRVSADLWIHSRNIY